MADVEGALAQNETQDDGPFSKYNNTHWKRVSTRNSRKAGYRVPDDVASDQIDTDRKIINHTARRNQSYRRRSSRDERPKKLTSDSGQQSIENDDEIVLAVDLEQHREDPAQRIGHPVASHPALSTGVSNSSVTSTAEILPNPYNRINRNIYSLLMSPCCMVFFVVCCYPGVRLMRRSDKYYTDNDDGSAKVTARQATFLLFFGLFLTLCLISVLLFVVIYFTTR